MCSQTPGTSRSRGCEAAGPLAAAAPWNRLAGGASRDVDANGPPEYALIRVTPEAG
jgi:hypothetical protein